MEVISQNNLDDCGVYLCKFMDYLTRGHIELDFSEEDIIYFRVQIGIELIKGKLLN